MSGADLGFEGVFNYCDASPRPSGVCSSGPPAGDPGFDLPSSAVGATEVTLTGNGPDAGGAAGWFQPAVALSSLTVEFAWQTGSPVYHTWFASQLRSVAGTVTPDGEPIPDADVVLEESDGEVVAETTTDEDGEFVLPDVPAGEYELIVTPPGGSPTELPVTVPVEEPLQVTAEPAPTPTPTPTPSPSPTEEPTDEPTPSASPTPSPSARQRTSRARSCPTPAPEPGPPPSPSCSWPPAPPPSPSAAASPADRSGTTLRMGHDARPAFVLHEHRRPRHHFDLRLEEDGVLRSWAVPRGLPRAPGENRLAVEVPDHDLDHLGYEDEDKSVADTGWWEEHDRTERRTIFTLHGRDGSARYALIRTGDGWLLRRTLEQPDVSRTVRPLRPTDEAPETPAP